MRRGDWRFLRKGSGGGDGFRVRARGFLYARRCGWVQMRFSSITVLGKLGKRVRVG